jgi:hypothetical protein
MHHEACKYHPTTLFWLDLQVPACPASVTLLCPSVTAQAATTAGASFAGVVAAAWTKAAAQTVASSVAAAGVEGVLGGTRECVLERDGEGVCRREEGFGKNAMQPWRCVT